MHHALLIDEILQLIFDHCAALLQSEPRWTLCQLARCCKAWRDPALDRLWSRIDGASPLVGLLNRTKEWEVNFTEVPSTFRVYATRVKEISHHTCFDIPILDKAESIMPRLEAATLSFHGCTVPCPWALSPLLKRVSINIGFARSPMTIVHRANMAADYLGQVCMTAPALQSLHIRGRMTDSLNDVVTSFVQLRSLTIYSSCFLTAGTLAAIAAMPYLQSLAVHSSAIHHTDFEDALARSTAPCFPALEQLEIRANGSLLATVIEHLPRDVLTKLRAEVDRSSLGPGYLKGAFEQLAHKTSQSLTELLVEDLTEFEDLDSSLRPQASPEWYPLSILTPLATLKGLRRFALTSMLPSALTDADLEQLGKWWPSLEHLNLGTFDSEYLPPDWPVSMTPAALPAVAKFLPRLESLALPILPIELVTAARNPPVPDAVVLQQKTLRSLTIGDVPDSALCATTLVRALLDIFPSLTALECPTHDVAERFSAVQLH
ncbi:hypothetical protein BC628DRAFT_1499751 [Trametes gibbosa]|nr:hypothetical protein BC628DRAFT_1499751 [Trametes gibbosa]